MIQYTRIATPIPTPIITATTMPAMAPGPRASVSMSDSPPGLPPMSGPKTQ